MSILCMSRVWDQSNQKGGRRLLLLAIADHADDNGFAWPGVPRLARKTRMSERHIRRMVAEIEADGELYVDRSQEEKASNQYIVLVGLCDEEILGVLKSRLKMSPKEAQVTLQKIRGDNLSPLTKCQGVGDKMSGGDDSRVRGGVTHESPEPSYNHHETTDKPSGDPPADYLADIHKFANGQNRAGVASPDEDPAAWLHYREQALNIYHELTGIYPDSKVTRPAIAALAGEPDFDPERWRNSVQSCCLAGVKRQNVKCMLDTYRAGGDYGAMLRGQRNGQGGNGKWYTDEEFADFFGADPSDPPAPDPVEALWSAALADLCGQMFPATFNAHLAHSRVERVDGTLRVSVSPTSAAWLNKDWLPRIVAAVRAVDESIQAVEVGT